MTTQKQIPYFPNTKEFSNYVDPDNYQYKSGQDYYQFLRILPTAGQKEIQRAILAAFKRYHPDKGADNAKDFEKVLLVKMMLTTPILKKLYDRTGFDAVMLRKAFDKITADISQCAFQGLRNFEAIKLALIENYQIEAKKQLKEATKYDREVKDIREVIDDINPDGISLQVIEKLETMVRESTANAFGAREEADNLMSIVWIVKNMNGKTPTELANFFSSTEAA